MATVARAARTPDRRLQAAYRLAAGIVARRHDRELRELAVRLLKDEEVDGVRLTAYLHRLAGRRREHQRPRVVR